MKYMCPYVAVMSWLTKVSELAGKAEDMLNKFDQSAGDVLEAQKAALLNRKKRDSESSDASRPARSSSYANLQNEYSITEEMGTSGPSRTHSEFADPRKAPRRRIEQFTPSTGVVREKGREEDMFAQLGNRDTKEGGVELEEPDAVIVEAPSTRASSVASARVVPTAEREESVGALKSQLWAKDSQLAMLRTKISDIEKKLEKRSGEYFELKAERDMLQQRSEQGAAAAESTEQLHAARKKAQIQVEELSGELSVLRRRRVEWEDEMRAMGDQLRLAKFNLAENKREFDEYKDKAGKILQAKERMVEQLKHGSEAECASSGEDRPLHVVQAELEEVRVERDLARADLESAQLMMYNVRSEMEELEQQLRDEQSALSAERRTHLEEKSAWQTAMNMLNEKVDCARIESEFVREELRRQADGHAKKLEERETEWRRQVEQSRMERRRDETGAGSMEWGARLAEKQAELEDAIREKQMLALRLERMQKSSPRETAVSMEQPATPVLRVEHRTARRAVGVADSIVLRAIHMLRVHPTARLFLLGYFVVLHVWVFLIVLTYTPEAHLDGHSGGAGGMEGK